ncbi:uncharacterized protein [Chironomus tepperi]|uniref:uncharacterized protein n=1 Tax=Chironomus tepperi TaxID=113505 RepID=UPI00391F0E4F
MKINCLYLLQMELLDSAYVPAFKENAEGSVAPRWKKWLKQFELHLKVKNIDDPELKKAHLLYYGKEDVQKVLEEADCHEDFVSDCYQRAIRKLNEYFLPKVSRIYERSVFRKMDREPEEKIESYILRLKKQADYCEFGEQTDWMIVDQIVEKMQENEIKKKILRGNYNLEEIQQIISTDDLVKKQLMSYERNEIEPNVNAIIASKRNNFECYSCGAKGHLSKDPKCPARDKICGNCNQLGHFKRKCRKRSRFDNESYGYKGNAFHKSTYNAKNWKPTMIHNISEETIESNESDKSKETIYNLNGGHEVDCLVGGVKMTLVLDTGASANVIAEKDWNCLKNQFKVLKEVTGSDRVFRAYGSKENLETIGRVQLLIEANGNKEPSWFYIIKDGQRSLLSGKTAEVLKIITIKKNVAFPKIHGI